MPLNCGIVGLPNVGKSTIFNALTASKAPAANYPFCTIDPNVGIVPVPDARMDRIVTMVKPHSIVPTTMEFVDIAGIVEGASKGEGLGNQFLSHIRQTDAILHVVRCFSDPEVIHVAGGVNPLHDIDIINTELLLADLDTVEKRRNKAEKAAKSNSATAAQKSELSTIVKLADVLNAGKPARTAELADDEKPGNVDVITRQPKTSSSETIADEARKGYDLLVIGIAKTRNPNGGFSKDVSLITKGFEGPLAVIDSHQSNSDRSTERPGRILIPVNGSEVSRRAVEVGLTLARANDAEVTALYVTGNANGGNRKNASRRRVTRRNELAVLKDIGELADRYEVNVRSTTRVNMAPDEAILRESKRGYDLIVLGVSRRPGDTLYFGNTAAAVLDRSETSNLFVAS